MRWEQVLLTGVIAGVVVQGIQWFKESFFRKRDQERNLQFGSALISQRLDAFALSCADQIADNEHEREYGSGHPDTGYSGVPNFPDFTDGVDLELLDPKILSEVLSIGTFRELGSGKIKFLFDVAGRGNAVEESDAQCAVFGCEAFKIAECLRRRANLPSPNYKKYGWDFKTVLREKNQKVIDRRAQEMEE